MTEVPQNIRPLLQQAFRYAWTLVQHDGDAEDLLQEACFRICRKGGPWDEGYLKVTIRHIYVDGFRRAKKVRFVPLEADHEVVLAEREVPFENEHPGMLTVLGPEEREFLYLAVVEDYSAAEIAKLTSKPRGTILSSISRAKEKLRRFIGAKDAGGSEAS